MKIHELAKISGVTTRTLRYYDSIGLLSPSYINESNYRVYSENEVNLLQQILYYKHLNIPLKEIKSLILDPNYDYQKTLISQKNKLLEEKKRIEVLIQTINQSLKHNKGEIYMTNDDKFNGFREEIIEEVESKYGEELRETYGSTTIDESYQKMRKLSKYEFNQTQVLATEIIEDLTKLLKTSTPDSEGSMLLCQKHQTWIQYYWPTYSKEAHLGLCKMYLEDERFKAYYEKAGEGATQFLYDAMTIYLAK